MHPRPSLSGGNLVLFADKMEKQQDHQAGIRHASRWGERGHKASVRVPVKHAA